MFEQIRRTALAAACLPGLSSLSAEAQSLPPENAVTATSATFPNSTLAANEATGLLPISGLALAALIGLGCATALSKRKVAECAFKLNEFDRFAQELLHFNYLHTSLGSFDRAVGERTGRAAQFPDLPQHKAFQEAWFPFLNSVGIRLNFRGEFLGEEVLYGRFDLLISKPAALSTLLYAYGQRVESEAALSRTSLRLLSEACEEYVLDYLTNYSAVGLSGDMNILAEGLHSARRSVEGLNFYRRLLYDNVDALTDYAHFHHQCLSEVHQEGEYYISPGSLDIAVERAQRCLKTAATKPELGPLALRILDDLQDVIERLQSHNYLKPNEDDGDNHSDPGCESSCALALVEEPAPIAPLVEHEPVLLAQILNDIQRWRKVIRASQEAAVASGAIF